MFTPSDVDDKELKKKQDFFNWFYFYNVQKHKLSFYLINILFVYKLRMLFKHY